MAWNRKNITVKYFETKIKRVRNDSLLLYRKVVIKINFIYDKIIIPMNQFADRHHRLMFWTPVVISTIALIASIAK